MVFSVKDRILIENLYRCVKANGGHFWAFALTVLTFWIFCQRFCLDFYLTLSSDFGVYHCECQSDLLLVLQGTVGAQKIGVVGNTIQVLLQSSSGVSLPKNYPNRPRIDKVIAEIERVQFCLKHSVHVFWDMNKNGFVSKTLRSTFSWITSTRP